MGDEAEHHLVDGAVGAQQLDLACARAATAHIDGSHGAVVGQDDGDAGDAVHFPQRPLQPHRAEIARHPLYRDLDVLDLRRRRRNIERAIELAHHDLLRDMQHLADSDDEGRKPS